MTTATKFLAVIAQAACLVAASQSFAQTGAGGKAAVTKPAPPAKASPAGKASARAEPAAQALPPAGPELPRSPAELEIAQRVYSGRIACELGAFMTVTPDPAAPGYFTVELQRYRFRMAPVESRTGAIRLEDPRSGAVLIQLANKSMLMNQKLGQRLTDECMSPEQLAVADALKKNPMPSILDPLPAKPGETPSAATVAVPVTVPQVGVTTTVTLTSTATVSISGATTTIPTAATATVAPAAGTSIAPSPAPAASAPR